MCLYCQTVCEFGEGMKLKMLTQEELEGLDPQLRALLGSAIEQCRQIMEARRSSGSTDPASKLT